MGAFEPTKAGSYDRDTVATIEGKTPILVVSRSAIVSGAERVLLSLAPLMAERGYEPALAAPPGSSFGRAWAELGLRWLAWEPAQYGGLRLGDTQARPGPASMASDWGRTVFAAARLARLAREFSLVHSNSLPGHLEAALAGRIARRPVVLHLHDMVRPGLGRYVLGTAAALASASLAISDAVAACVPPPGRRKVLAAPNGVDHLRFRPGLADQALRARLSPDGAPLVGIVGRLDPEKGIDVVIRAVARLSPSTTAPPRLVVVGSPSREHSYADLVGSLASRLLGERAVFTGQVDDVAGILSCLDVLVNASRAEPFGMTILEAQACGVPVVAAAAGGAVELVRDGHSGLVFPPGDEAALASALERLIADPALARRLANTARLQVEQHFGLEVAASRLAALYDSLVAAR